MRKRIFIAFVCLMPLAAIANPYSLDLGSSISLWIVLFFAFLVEAGIITLLLAFRGIEVLPVFVAYTVINAAVFFLFRPLSEREWPVWVLELLVTIVDATVIKFLVSVPAMQGARFGGVSYLRAVVVSAVGDGASYFVGFLAPYSRPD